MSLYLVKAGSTDDLMGHGKDVMFSHVSEHSSVFGRYKEIPSMVVPPYPHSLKTLT